MNKKTLLRSILFLPAHNKKFLKKIYTTSADAIAFDLEDGVPRKDLKLARKNVEDCLRKKNKKKFFVRINSLKTKQLDEDLKIIVHKNLDGIIIPKVSTSEEIKRIEKKIKTIEKKRKLKNKIKFLILIENTRAILEIKNISKSSKRVEGLIFGAEDYLADLGIFELSSNRNILYPRSVIAVAARAYNLSSIDTPFLNLKEKKGFLKHLKESKSLGYSGMLNIHPDQTDITNKTFSINKEEIKIYKKMIELNAKQNKKNNIFLHKDRMIGPPIMKLATKLLKN